MCRRSAPPRARADTNVLVSAIQFGGKPKQHFFGLAAQTMRRILVEAARTRRRAKRGGGTLHVSLTDAADVPTARNANPIALDDALIAFERVNARHSRVVELRFLGGLSLEEVAHVLGVSVGTVRRGWSLARAWLLRQLCHTNLQ